MIQANQPKTPHDEMLNAGGALWWAATLKSPEEMQNTKSLKVTTSFCRGCNNKIF